MNRELVDSELANIAFVRERRDRVASALKNVVTSLGDAQVVAILAREVPETPFIGTRPDSGDG